MIRPHRRVFLYFDWRARIQACVLVALMVAVALLEIVGFALLLPFFELLSLPDAPKPSRLLAIIGATVDAGSTRDLLLTLGVTITIFYLIKNVGTLFLYYIQGRFVFYMEAQFSRRLLETYLTQPYEFHLHLNSAQLLHNLTNAVAQVFMNGVMPFFSVLMEVFVIVAVCVAVFLVEPMAALAATAMLTVPMILVYLLLRHRLAEFGGRIERHGATSKQWINQSLGVVRDISILGCGDYFLKRYGNERFAEARYRNWSNLGMLAPRPLIEVIAIAGLMVAMAVVLADGKNTNEVLPVLGVFGVAAFRIMPSLNRLTANFTRIRISMAAVDNVLADLDLRASSRGKEGEDLPGTSVLSGEIFFDKVSYSYPLSTKISVNELSLRIPEGSSVAFVGESGSGKSTVINLLLGLFDPSSGKITVAGRDTCAEIRLWRQRIGYVPQSIYLFDDSLRRNIAIGVEDSEIDEAALQKAIGMAALRPLVDSLPEGVNTIIGEDGKRITGGERQRIGIARALYRDPDVLVFDEATSALDNETEKFIMEAIDSLRDRKTIVFIAHRLSTVRRCDRLFLMENGMLADSGDYETLASRNTAFRRLAALEPAGPAS